MPKISLFKNSFSEKPYQDITLEQFLEDIKSKWKNIILKLRSSSNDKKIKSSLPAVTISGQFKSRNTEIELSKKLIAHSGYIAIDIDAKDNPRMSTTHVIDHECVSQFVSCRGEGLKIIYKCQPVKTVEQHWRIYDAIEERLKKKKINIKVDSIVKSIASLQYVTYDPDPYINLKTKLIIKPLPPLKVKPAKKIVGIDVKKEVDTLNNFIKELGKKDVTTEYEDWCSIAFGLTYSLGEEGRSIFHKLSCNYKGYSKSETDEKYNYHLSRIPSSKPITLATVYDILNDHVGVVKAKQLNKLKGTAIGVGQGEECPDLVGMVRYKLFLFKKHLDKETHKVKALTPHALNLIAFGDLLKSKNFFRYQSKFVRIEKNIVEKVDIHTILWEISEYVKQDGDYKFTYNGEEYFFSWEDMYHLWKSIKSQASIHNSVYSDVIFWVPNLLIDSLSASFIPYQNGVAAVTKGKTILTPYENLDRQIWKERILPRSFKQSKKIGMFEIFFANVLGRGKSLKERLKSEEYNRGLWYYGYMLQNVKDPATARAWVLYDMDTGNNGRNGKSIIGDALGKIRYVTVIDGKQVDFKDRFWLQTVKEYTDIIFIDDPKVNTSIIPMFNMITGSVQPQAKNKDPLNIEAKFLIASNYVLEADGSSEADRQFISQVNNFYSSYSRENGDVLTPIVHYHGKRFFSGWDEKDWNEFDSFSIKALQFYLSSKPPKNTIIGNSIIIQFKQKYGEEIYSDLTNTFNARVDKVLSVVPRDSLVHCIKDNEPNISAKQAGSIARAFIKTLGYKSIEVTTMLINRLPSNVYKFK